MVPFYLLEEVKLNAVLYLLYRLVKWNRKGNILEK